MAIAIQYLLCATGFLADRLIEDRRESGVGGLHTKAGEKSSREQI